MDGMHIFRQASEVGGGDGIAFDGDDLREGRR